MNSPLSVSPTKYSKQLPDLNLDIIKKQNGFQKQKKPLSYGTTHQQIEITKEQFYVKPISSPRVFKGHARNSSDSVGSVNGSFNNISYSPCNTRSPKVEDLSFQDNSKLNIGKVKKASNFSDLLQECSTPTPSSPKSNSGQKDNQKNNSFDKSPQQNSEAEFFKNNELHIREIISLVSNELNSYHSELKQYLHAYGMSCEIFTFYLNRYLELSCGKEDQTQLFFKINDIIYYKTISILSSNPTFALILQRLDNNKHKILPRTLLEQICTRDQLKQIIAKIYEEAKNSTYMSEFFTSDKQINSEMAIQILEDAFAGDYSELQAIVQQVFGKNKFTHIFFYFFKSDICNVLKKQGIPKVLIYKVLEKIESLRQFQDNSSDYQSNKIYKNRYLMVEEHECINFKDDLEKLALSTLQTPNLMQKISKLGFLSVKLLTFFNQKMKNQEKYLFKQLHFCQQKIDQLQKFSNQFVKNMIFQPDIQVLRKHVNALVTEPQLKVLLIEQVCLSLNQYLQKKDIVDETIHEMALRKEKLFMSLELQSNLIQDNNIVKELIDMIKKGVKKEKHMIDDLKILENPTMVQSYLESFNSPYNCTSIKDWFGSVQLSQVTSWQIGIWFRILKTSIAKLKLNHHTQFLIEQELNYISNYL